LQNIEFTEEKGLMDYWKKPVVPLLVMLLITMPVWADESAQRSEENASETGKNEIRVCPKPVPIMVLLSPDYSDADRIEVLNKYEVLKRVEFAIACELENQGYIAAKPLKLDVVVTEFRLRSGASAAIGGFASGRDKLAVKVDASIDGGDSMQFREGASTVKGGWHMPAPSQRINYLVQELAGNLVKKMYKKGLLKQ
jgi:hypothetical protein